LRSRGIPALALLLLLAGCSTERSPGEFYAPTDVGTLVVQGLLFVDQPMPSVRLSRTVAPDVIFDPVAAAVSGADVEIARGDGVVFDYREDARRPGTYRPLDVSTPVHPGTRYHLQVRTGEGEALSAETVTPPSFTVTEWVVLDEATLDVVRRLRTFAELGDDVYDAPENQLVYQEGLLEARLATDDDRVFQVGLFSLDPNSPLVIDADFLSDEDLADLQRQSSSPAFTAPDSRIRLPWFSIFFAGDYKIRIHSVDENWYDLNRSAPELGGGVGFGNNAGDGFERPIFHVEGGIGLFGSAAVDSIGFTILSADE
jgi:hypothetical protein